MLGTGWQSHASKNWLHFSSLLCSLHFIKQLDEDIKTILQRFEGIVEEDSEQTSNEATLSYLDYLANLDSEQVAEELIKRSDATKEHTRKLLHYVEMSGPFTSRSVEEKLDKKFQIAAEKEENKGKVTNWKTCPVSVSDWKIIGYISIWMGHQVTPVDGSNSLNGSNLQYCYSFLRWESTRTRGNYSFKVTFCWISKIWPRVRQ